MLFIFATTLLMLSWRIVSAVVLSRDNEQLLPCGDAYYHESQYTCYSGDFLCPLVNGTPTLKCGNDCYLPSMYSCASGKLVYPPVSTGNTTCTQAAITQHLSDPPYENYFYSDCHAASQVVVTSPLADSNLTIIGPRLLVAWPAGNSGIVSFFRPASGQNGTLAVKLENKTSSNFELQAAYKSPDSNSLSGLPFVGVTSLISFNTSAILDVVILGSIRTMRDFTEGPSLLRANVQQAVQFTNSGSNGVLISRMWFDNVTTTQLAFSSPENKSVVIETNEYGNKTLLFEAGTYEFTAWFDYPQLTQLSTSALLNEQSQSLIESDENQTTSLSFLSYSEKLLAGAWRFLTYFGRDSMIAALLLQPVLSEGEGSAIEAVIGAVLERLNQTSGFVCHEETIGDYATYLNLQKNITGPDASKPGCTYQMVDTQFYLAPIVDAYFVRTETGKSRTEDFFAQRASSDFGNQGLTYGELFLINTEAVVNMTRAFAQPGSQAKENLIHLEADQIVGEWRDSTYGIGGGRVPYDVNTGLAPASLRAISALSAEGFFPSHPDWENTTAEYAQVWEDNTLQFFEVSVTQADAKSLLDSYVRQAGFDNSLTYTPPTSGVVFHGLSLDGNNNQSVVRVMNTDDCFRLFLTNTTNDEQLTNFIDQVATNIQAPFPVGLSNPVGLLIANPAYGNDPIYAANWTNNAYHGTVVWSWQMAMMGAGLQRQLGRCADSTAPAFCSNSSVHSNALSAYNHLWDLIEANNAYINDEVWSWNFQNGNFSFTPLGALPPPAGQSPTESNIRQLWSLTWLAVKRDTSLK